MIPRSSLATGTLVLAVGAALTGCQQAAPASSTRASTPTVVPAGPSESPGSSPAPTAASAPPAPGGPSLFSIDVATAPFLTPADGPEGSLWPLPAAATRAADGTLVLIVVWFGDGTAPATIGVATSVDGTAWDVGTEHIFDGLAIGHPSPGPVPSAVLQLDDGTWQIYGWAAANASGTAFLSWRASAADLAGPWVLDATDLLEPGPSGDWDSYMAAPGSVLPTEDGLAMWFEGEPPGSSNRGNIGLATSTAGLTWTRHDDAATTEPPFAASDPVIRTGVCGNATSVAVDQPQVERRDDGYVALFAGYGPGAEWPGIFGAVSDDGRAWQCGSPEPMLTGTMLGGSDGIHTIASMPLADGRIGLVAESLAGDHSELWWATVTVSEE